MTVIINTQEQAQAILETNGVPNTRTVNGHALTADVSITATDIGLESVNNTSDTSKPISTAQQTALDGKSSTSHTHAGVYEPANTNIQTHVVQAHAPAGAQANADITKAEIEAKLTGAITSHTHAGTGGDFVKAVDDTDDITVGAVNKFATAAEKTKLSNISVTQAVDLDTMESNIATNNAKISFDSASSTKLAGIATGAEVNVNADWNSVSGDSQILNKPTISGSNTGDNATNTQYSGLATSKENAITGTTAVDFWSGAKTFVNFATTVRATVLTGLPLVSTTVISATDTVLVALGSLQAQITALTSTVSGKAATVHTHAISDTTGLQTALDNKLDDTQFVGLSKITVGTSAPVAPSVGDLWCDSN